MLVVFQLVKKLSSFYETLKLITAFTRIHHFSVSWASWIQSTAKYHFVKTSFIIIFQCSPRSSKLSNPLFRFFYRNWMLSCYLQSGTHSPPIWSWNFDHSNDVGGGVQIVKRPHYQTICSLLLFTPSKIKIFSPAPFSYTISVYLLHSVLRVLIRYMKYFKRTNKCIWIYECNFIA
jgi:hypothetical protein